MIRRPPRSTLSLHDALPISEAVHTIYPDLSHARDWEAAIDATSFVSDEVVAQLCDALGLIGAPGDCAGRIAEIDRKSTRLNSSHDQISYAVFCLKKKKKKLS